MLLLRRKHMVQTNLSTNQPATRNERRWICLTKKLLAQLLRQGKQEHAGQERHDPNTSGNVHCKPTSHSHLQAETKELPRHVRGRLAVKLRPTEQSEAACRSVDPFGIYTHILFAVNRVTMLLLFLELFTGGLVHPPSPAKQLERTGTRLGQLGL